MKSGRTGPAILLPLVSVDSWIRARDYSLCLKFGHCMIRITDSKEVSNQARDVISGEARMRGLLATYNAESDLCQRLRRHLRQLVCARMPMKFPTGNAFKLPSGIKQLHRNLQGSFDMRNLEMPTVWRVPPKLTVHIDSLSAVRSIDCSCAYLLIVRLPLSLRSDTSPPNHAGGDPRFDLAVCESQRTMLDAKRVPCLF